MIRLRLSCKYVARVLDEVEEASSVLSCVSRPYTVGNSDTNWPSRQVTTQGRGEGVCVHEGPTSLSPPQTGQASAEDPSAVVLRSNCRMQGRRLQRVPQRAALVIQAFARGMFVRRICHQVCSRPQGLGLQTRPEQQQTAWHQPQHLFGPLLTFSTNFTTLLPPNPDQSLTEAQ